jgi:hypothetical protein
VAVLVAWPRLEVRMSEFKIGDEVLVTQTSQEGTIEQTREGPSGTQHVVRYPLVARTHIRSRPMSLE